VYDLTTRQTWTLGTGRAQAEASVVKVDILETLLAHGNRLSARQRSLAQLMIEDSDNDAATALWDAAGGAHGIGAFNASVGLTATTPSTCVQCPGFPWPGWGLTTTTPTDQIALLREIVEPGPLLTSAGRDYALRLMENVTPGQRWGVRMAP
jgi:beta-lactamase class A